ncbi:Metallo-dependent phosphatase-like [Phytophthora cactorum]|nr:Metallo-dependent phosphatase-like [Phytophthora cactorum]
MNDSNLSDQERRKIHDWERALLQDIKESAVDLADLQSDKFDRATDDLDALYQGVCYPREGNLDGLCLDELDSAVGRQAGLLSGTDITKLGYLTVVMTLYFKASELITASGNAYVNNSEFDWEALGNAVGSCFQSVVKKEKKKPRRVLQDKNAQETQPSVYTAKKEDIQDAQARRLGILETAIKRDLRFPIYDADPDVFRAAGGAVVCGVCGAHPALLGRALEHLRVVPAADNARIPIRYFQDAPLPLLESALLYAKEHVVADPELFLYTGDHAAHGLFTDEYIAKTGQEGRLEATAIIGNADGNPDYHMEVTDPETESNPSIELISEVWEDSLTAANMDLLNRRGYLSYALDGKLHVITLNTPSHLPDTSKNPDPFGQFAWLDKTLAELQSAGKFAYIAGHVAPIVDSYGGNPQWHSKYIVKYKNIVGKYADVIKAQFFGHVHSVEFRVPVTSLDGPTGEDDTFQLLPMYITGSISPLFGNNPSFMVWDYDTETYEVLDYAVYASNIAESEPQLDWKLLFRASEAYGLKSLSLTELSSFVHRVEQNDAVCYAKTLCTLKWWTTKGQYLACVDTAQTLIADTDSASVSPADVVAAASGSSATDNKFATNDVMMTIGATALATAVAVVCVALTVLMLRRAGVLKNRSQYDTVATL